MPPLPHGPLQPRWLLLPPALQLLLLLRIHQLVIAAGMLRHIEGVDVFACVASQQPLACVVKGHTSNAAGPERACCSIAITHVGRSKAVAPRRRSAAAVAECCAARLPHHAHVVHTHCIHAGHRQGVSSAAMVKPQQRSRKHVTMRMTAVVTKSLVASIVRAQPPITMTNS